MTNGKIGVKKIEYFVLEILPRWSLLLERDPVRFNLLNYLHNLKFPPTCP